MSAPTYRRPPSGQLDNPSADYSEALTRLDPLSCKAFVDFELTATTSAQYVPHGLKRPYRGAILVGQEASNVVIVKHPRTSTDAARRVTVVQSSAVAQTIRLLVF